MSRYTIGLDFGTNSCRALIVDITTGEELSSAVYSYPSGEAGVIVDHSDPNLARQNPADYLLGIEESVKTAIATAKKNYPVFTTAAVIGIGVDTTGSSPLPVDTAGVPLCFGERFRNNPAAMVWLWKDHTGFDEARQITETAQQLRPHYLAKIGGIYSSEWFWSKIWHCQKVAPEVFQAAYSFVEICDWIPAVLVGQTRPADLRRSICAAGHKAMFNSQWGGLPDETFLAALSPELASLRRNLYSEAYPAEQKTGNLSAEWAQKLGLSTKVAVAVGAFDAHMGAVGAGIQPGTLVKIIGTSTCDIMVWPNTGKLNDIPGVCGIVDGSVRQGFFGIEAGQSAVGDIFLWFVNNLVPDSYGRTVDEKFKKLEELNSKIKPGETGLLALDWNNGNRTILVDVRLCGLLIGQTLHTRPDEIYRALVESTAFGALAIIDRIEEYGVAIKDIVNCGGLAAKNPMLLQIYADITGRPMKISRSDQTPALGAALFAAVAAGKDHGGYNDVAEAQKVMTGIAGVCQPISRHHDIYKQLYALYRQLHDGFGTAQWQGSMYNVMKDLLDLRDRVRRES